MFHKESVQSFQIHFNTIMHCGNDKKKIKSLFNFEQNQCTLIFFQSELSLGPSQRSLQLKEVFKVRCNNATHQHYNLQFACTAFY